jgi:hypothetical protein
LYPTQLGGFARDGGGGVIYYRKCIASCEGPIITTDTPGFNERSAEFCCDMKSDLPNGISVYSFEPSPMLTC